MKIDNTRFSQPTRHHWRGASRDLLLLALSISKKGKEENSFENSSFVQSCKFVTNYRTFKEDFLKVVNFVHYLRAEGYDMKTFCKVRGSS